MRYSLEHSISRNGTEDGGVFGLLGNPKHAIHRLSEQLVQRLRHERKEAAVLYGTSISCMPLLTKSREFVQCVLNTLREYSME